MPTPNVAEIQRARIGERAYDIALGLRNVDDRAAILSDVERTNITGMAAVLAGAIKGRDVVSNAQALKRIAADVLRIPPLAFASVVRELADLELVSDVRISGGDIVSFAEQVPLVHDDLHDRLGEKWISKNPTELEQQFLVAVETVANAPVPTKELLRELGADQYGASMLRKLGENAELIRTYSDSRVGEISISPLYAFENPQEIVSLFSQHPSEEIQLAFQSMRQQTGYPVIVDGGATLWTPESLIVADIIGLGLVPAPTVTGADRRKRAFAILPFGLDSKYLNSKKQILDRALTLIACVRCGEVSGGYTRIKFPDALLRKLTDPDHNYTLAGHSSTERQYAPVIAAGMIRTVPEGDMLAAQLIPTPDNLESVELARTLLRRQGEALPQRGGESEAAELLFTSRDYLSPIETIAQTRNTLPGPSAAQVQELWLDAMGWR
jgi:hypothetical protein